MKTQTASAVSDSGGTAGDAGDDSDEQFRNRLAQAKGVLDSAGVPTAALVFGQAEMTVLNRANYQQFIDGAVRGKAA